MKIGLRENVSIMQKARSSALVVGVCVALTSYNLASAAEATLPEGIFYNTSPLKLASDYMRSHPDAKCRIAKVKIGKIHYQDYYQVYNISLISRTAADRQFMTGKDEIIAASFNFSGGSEIIDLSKNWYCVLCVYEKTNFYLIKKNARRRF